MKNPLQHLPEETILGAPKIIEGDPKILQRFQAILNLKVTAMRSGTFLPRDQKELQIFLDLFLLEKGIYELGYELNNRPDWVIIPLKGISHLLANQDLSIKEESAKR